MTHRSTRRTLFVVALLCANAARGQISPSAPAASPSAPALAKVDENAAGDTPADPGPLATGLSPTLTVPAIHRAMRKVADWQLATAESRFNLQWTYAALYDGLLAASVSTGDPRYHDAVLHMAERSHWKLIDLRFPHADDMAVGRVYLDLYREHPDPERIAATRDAMDRLVARPDDPGKILWWWCDALFMAPPVLARLSDITGNRAYLDMLDRQWWLTSAALYDPDDHLYFRDDRFLTRTEANGRKLFWARGNGWVLAGLTQVLRTMPAAFPDRARFVAQFQAMAARAAALQQPDGLWRSGLLDPQAYASTEVSGSAFFTYAMAWGMNVGLLERKTYTPVVTKAWAGLLQHIYADGRLGSIQPIGAAPDAVKPSSSYVYGVGAFLLAAAEVATLTRKQPHSRASASFVPAGILPDLPADPPVTPRRTETKSK